MPSDTVLWNQAIAAALEAMEEYDSRAADRYELMGHCLRAARPYLSQMASGRGDPQKEEAK